MATAVRPTLPAMPPGLITVFLPVGYPCPLPSSPSSPPPSSPSRGEEGARVIREERLGPTGYADKPQDQSRPDPAPTTESSPAPSRPCHYCSTADPADRPCRCSGVAALPLLLQRQPELLPSEPVQP